MSGDTRAGLWLRQAEGELKWAEDALRLADLFILRARAELYGV